MERRELEERIADHIIRPSLGGKQSVKRIASEVLDARDAVLAQAGEAAIDREKFETWLFGRSRQSLPVVGSVYEGLLTRLRRGEFDEEVQR